MGEQFISNGLSPQFVNRKYKFVTFQFPPLHFIPESYTSHSDFIQAIQNTAYHLMGFHQVIRYRMGQFPSRAKANRKQIKYDQFSQHNWSCQVCYSHLIYKWNRQKRQYILEKYELKHVHKSQFFKDYMIQRFQDDDASVNCLGNPTSDRQDSNQEIQLEQNSDFEQDMQEYHEDRQQDVFKAINQCQLGHNIEEFQTCGYLYDLDKNQMNIAIFEKDRYNQIGQEQLEEKSTIFNKISNQSKYNQFNFLKPADIQKQKKVKAEKQPKRPHNVKSEQEYSKSFPYKRLWNHHTDKLISYVKSHSFYSPLAKDIPLRFSDRTVNQISQIFREIHKSYPWTINQAWSVKVKKINATKKIQSTILRKRKFIKVRCYSLGSLGSQCPFKLFYLQDKGNGGGSYDFIESQSCIQHMHVETLIKFKQTKYISFYHALPQCQLNQNTKQAIRRIYQSEYIREIAPRIILEKFRRNHSILLFLPEAFLQKLFQLQFIACTDQFQIASIRQLRCKQLSLLTQNRLQNDVVVFLTPHMKTLFRVYNRLLIIESEPIHHNFGFHKTYKIYLFKGISYKGSQVCFGFGFVSDTNVNKIEILLKTFMTKQQTIPNTLLISKSDGFLYTTAHKFFDSQYPETVILTRELCVFPKDILNKELLENQVQFYQINLIDRQRQFIEFARNKNKQISRRIVSQLFQYDNLIQANSSLLQNGSFIGFDIKTASHLYFKNPSRTTVFNIPNIQEAANKIETLVKNIVNTNKRESSKSMYGLQVERILKISQVQNIRILMSKKPFKILLFRLLRISDISITVSQPPHFYIVESNFNTNIVTMNPARKNPLLLCDCRIREKTGIPCEHMLKIALILQLNLIDCIDKFWLIDSLATQRYTTDFSLEQIMKSKISPMYAHEGRKRIYDKLFKRMRKRKGLQVFQSVKDDFGYQEGY